ncbi:Yqey-like protein-domain-containing protein [Chaetomium sp. MPI-CAGE-AT-0009]|nr:Yqey-like protein-domain-containing protein [Chaetomium sp. MPI-CAGE-AT-0009]
MASKLSPFLLRSFGRPTLSRTAALRVPRATYSTEAPPPPPLLAKLKDDLKTAMRAKDANRLAVLRSVLAATLNASKTDKPIKTDVQLVGLLQKSARKSQEAAAEARQAGREDLAEKEEAQQRILEEYAAGSGVREIGEAELRQIIESTKATLLADGIQGKALQGEIIKNLFKPGGLLDGAAVEKKGIVTMVKEACEAK